MRSEIRDTMSAEAEAAHIETEQLALANKHDLDIQKQLTEKKALDAEYEALVQQEKDLAQKHRDELYELRRVAEDQVMAINNAAVAAAETAKKIAHEVAEVEKKHHYEKGEARCQPPSLES